MVIRYYFYFFLIELVLRRLRSLARKVRKVNTLRLGLLVRSVRNTRMYAGKVFVHYEPWWSPIQELVAAAVAYFQSRSVINFSHCAAPSH